jgi:hypothetical protein
MEQVKSNVVTGQPLGRLLLFANGQGHKSVNHALRFNKNNKIKKIRCDNIKPDFSFLKANFSSRKYVF